MPAPATTLSGTKPPVHPVHSPILLRPPALASLARSLIEQCDALRNRQAFLRLMRCRTPVPASNVRTVSEHRPSVFSPSSTVKPTTWRHVTSAMATTRGYIFVSGPPNAPLRAITTRSIATSVSFVYEVAPEKARRRVGPGVEA